MPGLDRTGPVGAGAMTGGGRGLCQTGGSLRPPTGAAFGRGRGRGFGRGMARGRKFGRGLGYGRGYGSPERGSYRDAEPATELDGLKNAAANLKNELDAIEKRIGQLQTAPPA